MIRRVCFVQREKGPLSSESLKCNRNWYRNYLHVSFFHWAFSIKTYFSPCEQ